VSKKTIQHFFERRQTQEAAPGPFGDGRAFLSRYKKECDMRLVLSMNRPFFRGLLLHSV
jgi:hypothetical protein